MPKLYEENLETAPISSLLDAGEYDVQVSGWKFFHKNDNPNKDDEHYDGVKFELTVLAGPGQGETGWDPAGRKFFPLLNRPRADMKDGGQFCRGKIKKACLCFGVEMTGDSWDPEEFLGRQARVTATVQPGQNGRGPQNDIDFPVPEATV